MTTYRNHSIASTHSWTISFWLVYIFLLLHLFKNGKRNHSFMPKKNHSGLRLSHFHFDWLAVCVCAQYRTKRILYTQLVYIYKLITSAFNTPICAHPSISFIFSFWNVNQSTYINTNWDIALCDCGMRVGTSVHTQLLIYLLLTILKSIYVFVMHEREIYSVCGSERLLHKINGLCAHSLSQWSYEVGLYLWQTERRRQRWR